MSDDALRLDLEAEIRAAPDDPFPYEVYADYLEELADPRAELIRVQVRLSEVGRTTTFATPYMKGRLQAAQGDLYAEHLDRWLGSLASAMLVRSEIEYGAGESIPSVRTADGFEFHFRWGFLHSLRVNDCTPEFADLLAREPELRMLSELNLTIKRPPASTRSRPVGPEHLRRMEEAPWSETLSGLIFQMPGDFDPQGVDPSTRALAGLVHSLPRLRDLSVNLPGASLTDAGLLRGGLPPLRALRVFHVRDFGIDDLIENPALSDLEELHFYPPSGGPRIPLGPLQRLIDARPFPALRALKLPNSVLADPDVERMARHGWFDSLRLLDLSGSDISSRSAEVIAAAWAPVAEPVTFLAHNVALNPDARDALREAGVRYF